jgi:glycosyltransferase involved in cell wall biosynthesis
MAEKKIIVLQGLSGTMGVWFFRTKQFYDYLIENHSDEFQFELIDRPFTQDDLPLLEKASVTHLHKIIQPIENFREILNAIKSNGGKLIVDNDDYWLLNSKHPSYNPKENIEAMQTILGIAGFADYITVASDELKRMFEEKGFKNVIVQYNCANPKIDQFQNKRSLYQRDHKIKTIGYVGGSSHRNDFELLDGIFSGLPKDKARVLVAGWDIRGGNYELSINPELIKDMGTNFNQDVVNQIQRSNGDINQVPLIPAELKEKYPTNMILVKHNPIQPHQTPYFFYEQIMTDNWKNVSEDSKQLLFDNFTLQQDLHLPELSRIWTKDVNEYCKAYDLMDIALVPLQTNQFNKGKSALKLIEAATRALPVICSDVAPYQEIGVHLHNCYMVKNDSLQKKTTKQWSKALSYMLNNPEHAIEMGINLQNDVSVKYNIESIIRNRMSLYRSLTNTELCEVCESPKDNTCIPCQS